MMSTDLIVQLSNEAAERAAAEGLTPYVPWNAEEVDRYERGIPFPNLGSHRPSGWQLVEHRMADKTGWGGEDEPAMTVGQLIAWVKSNLGTGSGYALIEEGEFQVVVGRFTKDVVRHTVNGQTSDDGWPYGTTHDMDCPGCKDTPFTASPRSETYWAS